MEYYLAIKKNEILSVVMIMDGIRNHIFSQITGGTEM